MINKALVQFDEFPLTIAKVRSLPEDQAAALAVLSYSVSENNALRKIYLSQTHDYIGEKAIDEIINVHQFVILRTWSSKLFETKEFLRSICGKKPSTSDTILRGLAEFALDDLKKSETLEGYETARDVRHEMTNHYSMDAARKNLPNVQSDALCNMYLHMYGGNDFFPLGEAVMFHGRLHRKWKNVATLEERRRNLDLWFDWCLEASSSFLRSHARFTEEIIFKPLGRSTFYTKSYWVPETLVAHPRERLTPVVFRKADDV